MDNASIHNKRAPGTPNSQTKKADLQDWLIQQNVDFSPQALRAELWDLVKEQLKKCPEYSIDKLVMELRPDITIERPPAFHCELNAIEMI